MSHPFDAAVIGSGPNGLAAAVVLADAGMRVVVYEAQPTVGGGLRSMAVFEGDTVHDHCASVLAFAEMSPFFDAFRADTFGAELLRPEIPAVHVQPQGKGQALHHGLAETCAGLYSDGEAWRQMVRRFDRAWDHIQRFAGAPGVLSGARLASRLLPSPIPLASAEDVAARFHRSETQALFAGLAAHSILPLERRETGPLGVAFAASAARTGWPVVKGGSQRLADGMARYVTDRGGVVRTRTPIHRLEQVETWGPILFDTAPEEMASIAGTELPEGYKAKLTKTVRGPSLHKVTYLLSEPIPWTHAPARRASTIHIGDTFQEIAQGESWAWQSARGGTPERPFLILVQPTVVDPSRSTAGRHTAWVYCHVPRGFGGDLSDTFAERIESHAPGFRDVLVAQELVTADRLEAENANLIGGDVTLGAFIGVRAAVRPTFRLPWTTPNDRLWICSAASPPGPGVHGANGFFAAKSALRGL